MSILEKVVFARVLRTASSERYLVQEVDHQEIDVAAIDIHYLESSTVSATVIVLQSKYAEPDMVRSLIETIDTRLLPMACLNDGDLTFTVVAGNVIGQYSNAQE